MKPRRLLCLDAQQMTAYCWRSGVLQREAVFEPTETGQQQFSTYLCANLDSIFSMLVNVSEEALHVERIPRLRGQERSAFIMRKLGQVFFNTKLSAYLSQGVSANGSASLEQEQGARASECLLFAALTNERFFAPWLQAISSSGIALQGIYSLPWLVSPLLKKLRMNADKCLFFSVHDQNLRQSYLENGELRITRFSALHDLQVDSIAQVLSEEMQKFQQYLANQRLVEREQHIPIYVLASADLLTSLGENKANAQYQALSLEHCCQLLHKKSLKPLSVTEIFVSLLAISRPRLQFADANLRRVFNLLRLRFALNISTILVFLLATFLATQQYVQSTRLNKNSSVLQAATLRTKQQYEQLALHFPKLSMSNDELRSVINQYQNLEKTALSPKPFYQEVSRALQLAPTVEIERMDWEVKPWAASEKNTPQIFYASQTLVLQAYLTPEQGASARQMLAAFDNFVALLKKTPDQELEILQRPFEIDSDKPLKGDELTLEGPDGHPLADNPRFFRIKLTRKISP